MGNHKVLTSNEDIDRALSMAAPTAEDPRVLTAKLAYLGDEPIFILGMGDGSRFLIPKAHLEGLEDVTDEVASKVEIGQDGLDIRWPNLDLDFYVPYLLQGIYGTKSWMATIGQKGGMATTDAKRDAARKNGLKGGRPRKAANRRALSSSPMRSGTEFVVQTIKIVTGPTTHREAAPSYLTVRHSRAEYAVLFNLPENARSRALPRIA